MDGILTELFADFPFRSSDAPSMLAEVRAAFAALKAQVLDLAQVAEYHLNENAALAKEADAMRGQLSSAAQKRIAIEGELVQLRLQLEAFKTTQEAAGSDMSFQYVSEARRQVQLFLQQKELEYSHLTEQSEKRARERCGLALDEEYRRLFQQQEAQLRDCLIELDQLKREKEILVQRVSSAAPERPSVKETVLQKLQETVNRQRDEIEKLALQTPENLQKQLRILQETLELERQRATKLEEVLDKQKKIVQEAKESTQRIDALQQMYDQGLNERAVQMQQLKRMEAALATSAQQWDLQTNAFASVKEDLRRSSDDVKRLQEENGSLWQLVEKQKAQLTALERDGIPEHANRIEELKAENQSLLLHADEMAAAYALELQKLKQENDKLEERLEDEELKSARVLSHEIPVHEQALEEHPGTPLKNSASHALAQVPTQSPCVQMVDELSHAPAESGNVKAEAVEKVQDVEDAIAALNQMVPNLDGLLSSTEEAAQ